MNNNTPSGAISLDELNNMPGMEMSATPNLAATPAQTPAMPTPGTMSVNIPTTPPASSEPVTVPTEAEATEASPNIAGGGAIDLSELANMSDAAFDTMAAANTATTADEATSNAPDASEQPQPLTEEEIAANEAQARAESEANLAEASASMQNMHQNIMADVKPKEKEEVAQASIASKSRHHKKLSKKAILIIVIAIIVLAGGGALAYLIITGFFHTKEYSFGNWSVRVDESVYNVESSDSLKLTAKDGSKYMTFTDIGELDHKGLLKDASGMKSMFAEDGYKIDSSNEEINGVLACAVYKLTERSTKNVVYTAYCNINERMFSITAGAKSTDNESARAAFDESIEVVRNAKRK